MNLYLLVNNSPLNVPNVPRRTSTIRLFSINKHSLVKVQTILTNYTRIKGPRTRPSAITIRVTNKGRGIFMLTNMTNNATRIPLPINFTRNTIIDDKIAKTTLTLRRNTRRLTTLATRNTTTKIRNLPLTISPTTRPGTINNLMSEKSLRVTILYLMNRDRVVTLLPKIVLFPRRTRFIRRNLTLENSPNTKTIQIRMNVTLTHRPLTRRRSIQHSVLQKSIRITILVMMNNNGVMRKRPLTIITINPIRTRDIRPLRLLL